MDDQARSVTVGHTQRRSPPPLLFSDKSFLFLISKFLSSIEQNFFLHRTLFFSYFYNSPRMRESNFAFPAQNRAAVCISSQLYDRRGALVSLQISAWS